MMGIALALSLICPASVDTLYKVEFNSILNDWIPGPQWSWHADCMNVHLLSQAGGVVEVYDSDSLRSPVITLPSDIDSVVVVFDHWYYTYGTVNIWSWAETTMSLQMLGPSVSPPVDLWSVYYYTESPLYTGFEYLDSGLVAVPLPQIWPGEPLCFRFNGRVGAWTDYLFARSTLSWDIRAFYILNYTDDRSFTPSTWGSIKTLF